jgi:hypothetical protein
MLQPGWQKHRGPRPHGLWYNVPGEPDARGQAHSEATILGKGPSGKSTGVKLSWFGVGVGASHSGDPKGLVPGSILASWVAKPL